MQKHWQPFIHLAAAIGFCSLVVALVYAIAWIPWPPVTWERLAGEKSFLDIAATIATPAGLIGAAIAFWWNASNTSRTAISAEKGENADRFAKGIELLSSEASAAQAAAVAMIARCAIADPSALLDAARGALSAFVMERNMECRTNAIHALREGADPKELFPGYFPSYRALVYLGRMVDQVAASGQPVGKARTVVNAFYATNSGFDDVVLSRLTLNMAFAVNVTFNDCEVRDLALNGRLLNVQFVGCRFEGEVRINALDADNQFLSRQEAEVYFLDCRGLSNVTINGLPAED